jgi:hypothetical protein
MILPRGQHDHRIYPGLLLRRVLRVQLGCGTGCQLEVILDLPGQRSVERLQVLSAASGSLMERLKELSDIKEELLTLINQQIATRIYMLGELVGTLYPRMLQSELDKLETLKVEVLKLGEAQDVEPESKG